MNRTIRQIRSPRGVPGIRVEMGLEVRRDVYWGHSGITLIKRGLRGRDDLWQVDFPVGVTGPIDGTIGSPEREHWRQVCRDWLNLGKLPIAARELHIGHSRWSAAGWVSCDCGARYVQDCRATPEPEAVSSMPAVGNTASGKLR